MEDEPPSRQVRQGERDGFLNFKFVFIKYWEEVINYRFILAIFL
ncbi:hypothetical protein NSP_42270 [Nodularia spumigena CCY9414]|nr:hypothetical protein NSP_42270 [Nodularia spumigena CCY9414]